MDLISSLPGDQAMFLSLLSGVYVPVQRVPAPCTIQVLHPAPPHPQASVPLSVLTSQIQPDGGLPHHVFQLHITNCMLNGDVRNDFP